MHKHTSKKKENNLNTHLCTCRISFSLSFTFSWRFPTALAKHHLSLPRSLLEERWRAQKRADEGGKEGGSNGDVFQLGWFMAGCCHYFTIYWRNQVGQLKLCGGRGGHQGWRKHTGGVTRWIKLQTDFKFTFTHSFILFAHTVSVLICNMTSEDNSSLICAGVYNNMNLS